MDDNQQHGAVLITGTSTGIGRASALRLDQLGYRVFATVRNERDADALRSQASERLTPLLFDVTDETSITQAKEAVNQAVADAGLVGLVNNAGFSFTSPLEFVPLQELRRLFEVNFFCLLAVTQAFLPLLRQAHGRIVNISSAASIVVAPFHGPYSTSKLALNGLSDALRLELRPLGVQVSIIIYGSVNTPIWDRAGDLSDRVIQDYPSQAWDLYGANYRILRDYFRRMGEAGIPPEKATQVIVHALTAKRPKTRYYVGRDARLYNIYNKVISGRLRDWVVMRSLGLSDTA